MRASSRWISARSKGVMNCRWSRSKARWAMLSPSCSTSLISATFRSMSVKSSNRARSSRAPRTVASAWASKSSKNSSDFGINFSSMRPFTRLLRRATTAWVWRRSAAGQPHPESRAIWRAFQSRLPAHRLREMLDDGEPEPGSSKLARAAGIRAVEALEDARLVLRLDAGAGIHDRQHHRRTEAVPEQGDPAAPRRELDRVVQQVDEDLLERAPIGHRAQPFRHVRIEHDALLAGALAEEIEH